MTWFKKQKWFKEKPEQEAFRNAKCQNCETIFNWHFCPECG
jgi:hypothetical protein